MQDNGLERPNETIEDVLMHGDGGPAGEEAATLEGARTRLGEVPEPETYVQKLRGVLREDRLIQVGLVYAIFIVVVAVVGPMLMTPALRASNLSLRFFHPFTLGHGWPYILGADAVGHSFLVQMILATRTTLLIAGAAVISVAVIGTLLGVLVGYVGGAVDNIAMRAADVMLAFPTLLLALVVLYTLPSGILTLVFVLAATRLAVYVRVARSEALSVRERLFVRAARALGAQTRHIIFRQMLPVITPLMMVLATLEFALVILSESGLSFLGIGVQPPDVTWGLLIAGGQNYLRDAWWVSLFPGLAIALTTITVNILADWFRRASESW